jgi:hypothetical protein
MKTLSSTVPVGLMSPDSRSMTRHTARKALVVAAAVAGFMMGGAGIEAVSTQLAAQVSHIHVDDV